MAQLNPLQVASLISGGTSLLGTGVNMVGNYFNKRATLEAIKNLPKYEIPQEMYTMLDLYKQRAGAEMPGMDIAKENLQSQQAAAIGAAREAGGGAASINAAMQSQVGTQAAFNNLAVQAAQYRAQRQSELGSAYQSMAGYKDKAWEINTYNPAMMKMETEANYRNAQLSALTGGLTKAGTAGVNYFGQKAYEQQLEKMNPWQRAAAVANSLMDNKDSLGAPAPNSPFIDTPIQNTNSYSNMFYNG